MKRKKTRSSSSVSHIFKAQASLRRGVKSSDVVDEMRRTVPVDAFISAVQWIRSNPARMWPVLHDPFPETLLQLKPFSHSSMRPVPWDREFAWAVASFNAHATPLKRFVELQAEFESALLEDSYARCLEILDQGQSEIGYSLWLIKKRVHLLQISDGLDAQKSFAEQIRDILPSGNLTSYVTFYVSMRNEPSVTIGRFKDQFDSNFQTHALPADFEAYLRYHIVPDIVRSEEAAANLLRFENYGAIVDYYEMFVALSRDLACRSSGRDLQLLVSLVQSTYQLTQDQRLASILVGVGAGENLLPISTHAVNAYEYYLKGEYVEAAASARSALVDNPADLDAISLMGALLALGQTAAPDGGFLLQIAGKIAGVMRKDSGAVEDSLELVKIGMNMYGSPLSYLLTAIVVGESSSDPRQKYGEYAQAAALASTSIHPRRVRYLPKEGVDGYLNELEALSGKRLATVVAKTIADGLRLGETLPEDLSAEQRALLLATAAYLRGEYDTAALVAQPAEESAFEYFRAQAARIVSSSLVHVGKTGQALEFVTQVYLAQRGWYRILPIEAIADEIAADTERRFAGEIATPILFDMYARYVSGRYDSERVFAFLDFLEVYGYSRPTELISHPISVGDAALIYFLRYICVESIMDRSGVFDSSRSILEERLTICRRLVEIDEEGGDAYHTEIKSLLRRLMVQRRMKEVEQSKIYVDTDSIKRKVEDDLRESFNRYRALRLERPESFDIDPVLNALRKASEGDRQDLTSLTLPKNERAELFASIIRRLRDEYVSSPEHGLDKYLSVRIRHGTLAAHLRRPVETAKLVTARELGSADYKRNEYWENRLWANPATLTLILQRLQRFSRDFDEFVDQIKSWIHIKKDSSGSGLFDFTLYESGVRILSESLTPDTSFETFIAQLLENFGLSLDLNLQRVRSELQSRGKEIARRLLDGLATDVALLGDTADVGELVNSIRTASTDLQVALDRVTAWFERANTAGSEPFTVQDTIELSVEAVRTVAPDFHVEMRGNVHDPIILGAGPFLTIFVDVFFIIFENVVRHSGLSEPAASVHLDLIDTTLTIRVENAVGAAGIGNDAIERLAMIRRAIDDDKQGSIVNREGGTGFHKLRRILTHDLLVAHPHLGFHFADDLRTFSVQFSLPISPQ